MADSLLKYKHLIKIHHCSDGYFCCIFIIFTMAKINMAEIISFDNNNNYHYIYIKYIIKFIQPFKFYFIIIWLLNKAEKRV